MLQGRAIYGRQRSIASTFASAVTKVATPLNRNSRENLMLRRASTMLEVIAKVSNGKGECTDLYTRPLSYHLRTVFTDPKEDVSIGSG